MSHPDPNRSGDAYLEEFEDDHSIPLLAGENAWRPGSVPRSSVGLESVVGQRFDSADAVPLIWQNLVPNTQLNVTLLAPQDIDPTIASTASATAAIEPVLWMSLHADTAGGIVDFNNRSHWSQPARPGHARWRSMTTALSTTGADLSRNDYFEFALYETSDQPVEKSQMRIVIDLGRVSEDALALAPTTFRVLGAGETAGRLGAGDTVFTGRQYVGVGTLNTEKTLFGTWDATTDDIGILGDRPDSLNDARGGPPLRQPALCIGALSAQIQVFPWGDLGAHCTNHNGVPDTEDLDGDNILDAQGSADDVFRYVVDLRDSASYFVRRHVVSDPKTHVPIVDRLGRTSSWTIYRVPLHVATDTIGNPDIHLVKQMRMTFATPPADSEPVVQWAMALMKLTGAAWIARADRPIKSLSGATAQFQGSVVIGTVSTQDSSSTGLGYTSPPGIGNAGTTVAVSQNQAPQQINEKSLRIQVTDLQPGERAEGYTRLATGTQSLLSYRAATCLGARTRAGLGQWTTAGLCQARQRRLQLLSLQGARAHRDMGSRDGHRPHDLAGLAAEDRNRPVARRAAQRVASVRRRFDSLRRLHAGRCLRGAGARPADQSPQPQRGAGAGRRHVLQRGHRPADRSYRALGGRYPGVGTGLDAGIRRHAERAADRLRRRHHIRRERVPEWPVPPHGPGADLSGRRDAG